MKKPKMSAAAIKSMQLEQLNISGLTSWLKNGLEKERKRTMARILARQKKGLLRSSAAAALTERARAFYNYMEKSRPTLVGTFTAMYYWQCPAPKSQHFFPVGLGKKTVDKIMQKVSQLGMTPDDWPALAQGKLIYGMSQEALAKVPVSQVLRRASKNTVAKLLDVSVREADIILENLLTVDPSTCSPEQSAVLQARLRGMVGLWQKLKKKGLKGKDFGFLNWDPETPSIDKARKMLAQYNLPSQWEKRFAKILFDLHLVLAFPRP